LENERPGTNVFRWSGNDLGFACQFVEKNGKIQLPTQHVRDFSRRQNAGDLF
jgi:hypothetical protein